MENFKQTSKTSKSMLITVNGIKIEIPFPKERYNEYLKNLGIPEKMEKNKIDPLFRQMVIDFRKGRINVDDLAAMSNHLFNYFSDQTDEEWLTDKYSRIKNLLEIAADLSYHIRFPSETLIEYLKEVLAYPDYSVFNGHENTGS